MFLQDLWRLGIDWDEELDPELKVKWDKIYSDIKEVLKCSFPRKSNLSNKSVLHAFSDSSLKAYGSVVFTVTDGKVDLVIAKARVTPIKSPTLPQLELIAANLSAKLVNCVVNACPALNNVKIYCWTDSQIVLYWINSQKSLKSCVQGRVDDIKAKAPTADWRYVYSECNPADYFSRSMTAKAFLKSDL